MSGSWEWNDGRKWVPYDAASCAELEQALTTSNMNLLLTQGYFASNPVYIVDLQQMIQVSICRTQD